MIKFIISSVFILFVISHGSSAILKGDNNPEKEKISACIRLLFEGMKKGDSSMVHMAFHDNVIMQTVSTGKTGETQLHRQELQKFLNAVGTPHKEVWNEKINSEIIQIDGEMAHVWTEYMFYVDDTFMHCGVNSFQLAKLNNQWKIVSIMDTRRKEGCKEK